MLKEVDARIDHKVARLKFHSVVRMLLLLDVFGTHIHFQGCIQGHPEGGWPGAGWRKELPPPTPSCSHCSLLEQPEPAHAVLPGSRKPGGKDGEVRLDAQKKVLELSS